MHYGNLKNSSSAKKRIIYLDYKNYTIFVGGSPGEHFAVGSRSGRKITEIHGLEVDNSSSRIFGHMVVGNV